MNLTYKAIARSAGYIAERTSGRFSIEGFFCRDTLKGTTYTEKDVYPSEYEAYRVCCTNEGLIL